MSGTSARAGWPVVWPVAVLGRPLAAPPSRRCCASPAATRRPPRSAARAVLAPDAPVVRLLRLSPVRLSPGLVGFTHDEMREGSSAAAAMTDASRSQSRAPTARGATSMVARRWRAARSCARPAQVGAARAQSPQEKKRADILHDLGLRRSRPRPGAAARRVAPAARRRGQDPGAGRAANRRGRHSGPAAPSFSRAIHPAAGVTCKPCHAPGCRAACRACCCPAIPPPISAWSSAWSTSRRRGREHAAGQGLGRGHARGRAPWPAASSSYQRALAWIQAARASTPRRRAQVAPVEPTKPTAGPRRSARPRAGRRQRRPRRPTEAAVPEPSAAPSTPVPPRRRTAASQLREGRPPDPDGRVRRLSSSPVARGHDPPASSRAMRQGRGSRAGVRRRRRAGAEPPLIKAARPDARRRAGCPRATPGGPVISRG